MRVLSITLELRLIRGREWSRAAEKEHASAEHNLGIVHKNDEAPEGQDHIKAWEYYLRVDGRGHAKAQFSVGLLYDTEKGFNQDSRKALRWYLSLQNRTMRQRNLMSGSCMSMARGWSGI